jgi:protein transport protein SEC31
MATTISGAYLTPGEKKQSAEVEKGVAIFSKRLARGDIDATVVQKVSQIVAFLSNREFSAASGIHTELVNSYWKENKDWLRGMKLLIQLLSKKT